MASPLPATATQANIAMTTTLQGIVTNGINSSSPQSSLTSFTEAGSTVNDSVTTLGTSDSNNQQPTPTVLQQYNINPQVVPTQQPPPAALHQATRSDVNLGRLVDTSHDVKWYTNHAATQLDINGPSTICEFVIKNITGARIKRGSDIQRCFSRLDYFLMMFPPKQLRLIVQLTNVELSRDNKPTTTVGEILKMFGIMIMLTRFEFGARSELWCTTQRSKYIPTPSLGQEYTILPPTKRKA